ncbi:hypothetical protein V8F33_004863 [Rhypophila sp. PSN 637]
MEVLFQDLGAFIDPDVQAKPTLMVIAMILYDQECAGSPPPCTGPETIRAPSVKESVELPDFDVTHRDGYHKDQKTAGIALSGNFGHYYWPGLYVWVRRLMSQHDSEDHDEMYLLEYSDQFNAKRLASAEKRLADEREEQKWAQIRAKKKLEEERKFEEWASKSLPSETASTQRGRLAKKGKSASADTDKGWSTWESALCD